MRILIFWIALAVLIMLSRESIGGKLNRENVCFNFTILKWKLSSKINNFYIKEIYQNTISMLSKKDQEDHLRFLLKVKYIQIKLFTNFNLFIILEIWI